MSRLPAFVNKAGVNINLITGWFQIPKTFLYPTIPFKIRFCEMSFGHPWTQTASRCTVLPMSRSVRRSCVTTVLPMSRSVRRSCVTTPPSSPCPVVSDDRITCITTVAQCQTIVCHHRPPHVPQCQCQTIVCYHRPPHVPQCQCQTIVCYHRPPRVPQCQTIVEEQEDELMAFLSEERENASQQFCHHETSLCPQHDKDELWEELWSWAVGGGGGSGPHWVKF